MCARQVKAPRQDGAVVAEPPLADAGALFETNRRLLAGRRRERAAEARRALLAEAAAYHREAGQPTAFGADSAVVMAGHQPELFHPGVWVKNFAIHGLARRLGAAPVNLVVDNDTVKSTSLHYPRSTGGDAVRAAEPFDERRAEEPYEERVVRDEALFDSLPDRVRPPWPFEPLLPSFWEEVRRQAGRTRLLGERFAAARRALERSWGCANVEVPVSRVCRTEPFAAFAAELLADLPRFHAVYNECVRDYRRRHGLSSPSHPVPDLARDGDWLEAPFWAWRAGTGRRGRLMARAAADRIELRVGGEAWPALPRGRPEAYLALERQGLKVRSRALTNTLYARLFLCDLFVHGIGGGKYDEVTDAILRRYYGAEPPGYLVLSATLLLPLPAHPDGPDDLRRLHQEARDLTWNPQRHLGDDTMRELVDRKRALIAAEPSDRAGRRRWFHELRAVTEALRQGVDGRLAAVRDARRACERRLHANGVLRRRDYAFCLYPEAQLRPFCERFLGQAFGALHMSDEACLTRR